MYEKEEQQLKQWYQNIEVPVELVDEAIFTGYQKAVVERKRQSRLKKTWVTLAAAVIILVGFFTSIRLSPAFADYITVFPGMEKIVDLIRNDKGKLLAVANKYYEKIGVSQEKNELKMTIDGAIMDENGLVLFYTIDSKEKLKDLRMEDVQIESMDGEKLNLGSVSMGSPLDWDKSTTSYSDMFEFYFQSPSKAKKLQLKVSVVNGQKLKEEFNLKFDLKKKVQKKKSYILNKAVTIEGQKFSFLDADVYPLRVAVHVKMDPANTKRILSFEDLRLVDESGEIWNKINNGVTASLISPDEAIIYLQSNYFREPKELYLVVNKMQAIDKDEVKVIVDTKKSQILRQPAGDYLSNVRMQGDDLLFNLQTKKEFNSFLFSNITDGNGKEIVSTTGFMGGRNEKGITEIGINIPGLKNQNSPISLELTSYPSWIEGEGKIKIK